MPAARAKCIGILTSGGDCPGLNAAIRGVAKPAMSDFHIEVIGLPKTIDNDLAETDITFGFDSAVTTAAEAIDRLYSTAEAHLRVMVIELMGHNAGWLALTAGVAGGADIILIPEIPYDIESI